MSRGSIFSFHKVPRVLYKLHNSFAMTKGVQNFQTQTTFLSVYDCHCREKQERRKSAKEMKTEADWKYSPVLLCRPDIHPYDLPRMRPSFPRTEGRQEQEEYRVRTSTLRYWLIGKDENNNNYYEIFWTFIPGNPIDNLATLRANTASNIFWVLSSMSIGIYLILKWKNQR